jgi:hypothetical protein
MANPNSLKLVTGGSREGTAYIFIGDVDSLRQLALNLLAGLDGRSRVHRKAIRQSLFMIKLKRNEVSL